MELYVIQTHPSERPTNWINCLFTTSQTIMQLSQVNICPFTQINKLCSHKQRSLTAGRLDACVQVSSPANHYCHLMALRDKCGLERLCFQIHRSCISFSQPRLLTYYIWFVAYAQMICDMKGIMHSQLVINSKINLSGSCNTSSHNQNVHYPTFYKSNIDLSLNYINYVRRKRTQSATKNMSQAVK